VAPALRLAAAGRALLGNEGGGCIAHPAHYRLGEVGRGGRRIDARQQSCGLRRTGSDRSVVTPIDHDGQSRLDQFEERRGESEVVQRQEQRQMRWFQRDVGDVADGDVGKRAFAGDIGAEIVAVQNRAADQRVQHGQQIERVGREVSGGVVLPADVRRRVRRVNRGRAVEVDVQNRDVQPGEALQEAAVGSVGVAEQGE